MNSLRGEFYLTMKFEKKSSTFFLFQVIDTLNHSNLDSKDIVKSLAIFPFVNQILSLILCLFLDKNDSSFFL